MAHLDFREALSTPDQKILPTATVVAAPVAAATPRSFVDLVRSLRLSRSTWANIVFVAIASAGGVLCAFYFFNGGELLQAAASWPREYLYPRPLSVDQIALARELNAFDRLSAAADVDSAKTTNAKNLDKTNGAPSDFLQTPSVALGTNPGPVINPPINPPSPPGPIVIPPIPPGPPTPPSLIDQTTSDVTTTVTGTDPLVLSVYQMVTSAQPIGTVVPDPANVAKSNKRKISKASSSKQKVATTTTSSTARSLQQNANQTMSTARPLNQMMSSGGLGGMGSAGLIGSVGSGGAAGATGASSGVGSTVGGTVGGVGGAAGGLGGTGLGGAGLGGTIGGVGGTVGGVVGGHH